MGPLRIIILAVLLYIGYRLITKSLRSSDNADDDGQPAADGSTDKITDILVEDPVCHKLVPKQQAHRLESQGREHFFCSQACCDKFVAEQGDKA